MSRNQARADRHLLARQYPAAFSETGGGRQKKPLKVGIHTDLIQRGVLDREGKHLSPRRIANAVRIYTVGPKYTFALTMGGARFDLDGKPCGEVSEHERASAAKRLMQNGWRSFFTAPAEEERKVA